MLFSAELCSICGQPDNCGDCNHSPMTEREIADLLHDYGGEIATCQSCGAYSDPMIYKTCPVVRGGVRCDGYLG